MQKFIIWKKKKKGYGIEIHKGFSFGTRRLLKRRLEAPADMYVSVCIGSFSIVSNTKDTTVCMHTIACRIYRFFFPVYISYLETPVALTALDLPSSVLFLSACAILVFNSRIKNSVLTLSSSYCA